MKALDTDTKFEGINEDRREEDKEYESS